MSEIIVIHNVSTGEITEREATPEELEIIEQSREDAISEAERINAKAAAKAALLERLGITEEEAKLLLG